jgi:hypothetical protein
VHYGDRLQVRLRLPASPSEAPVALAGKYFNQEGVSREEQYGEFDRVLDELRRLDDQAVVYSDVLEFLDRENEIAEGADGKLLGYRGLDLIPQKLEPILPRRTRKEVLPELPPRTGQGFHGPLTPQQAEPYWEQSDILARLMNKRQRQGWLSEIDLRRITCCIQNMRMLCDSTYLFDKTTRARGRAHPEARRADGGVSQRSGLQSVPFHRRGRRGSQPPGVLRRDQLRASLEPGPPRTAYRPCPPPGAIPPGAGDSLPHFGQHRGARLGDSAAEEVAVRGRVRLAGRGGQLFGVGEKERAPGCEGGLCGPTRPAQAGR